MTGPLGFSGAAPESLLHATIVTALKAATAVTTDRRRLRFRLKFLTFTGSSQGGAGFSQKPVLTALRVHVPALYVLSSDMSVIAGPRCWHTEGRPLSIRAGQRAAKPSHQQL
ncbi:hypothetical protein Ate01nite_02360 [Actinoplanes teichomyceticus]|nr:hypothetical protein Ate01nite_02360 [Actinoplanes teichomyceticus]